MTSSGIEPETYGLCGIALQQTTLPCALKNKAMYCFVLSEAYLLKLSEASVCVSKSRIMDGS
jgi:hypothetical protein